MSISVACAKCGISFKAYDQWAGKKVPCPGCGTEVLVAGSPSPSMSADTATLKDTGNSDAAPAPEKPAEKTSGKSPDKPKPIARAKRIAPHESSQPQSPQPPYYGMPSAAPQPYATPAQFGPGGYVPQPDYGRHPQQPGNAFPPEYIQPNPNYPPQYFQQGNYSTYPGTNVPIPTALGSQQAPLTGPQVAPQDLTSGASLPAIEVISKSVARQAAANKPNLNQQAGVQFAENATSQRSVRRVIAACFILGAGVGIGIWAIQKKDAKPVAADKQPPPSVASAAPALSTPAPAAESPIPEDLADVVDRIKPAIVLITVRDSKGEQLGLGSGFVIANGGLVVTNHHVVAGGARATATFSNGTIFDVTGVLKVDQSRDMAIIKIDSMPPSIVPLEMASDVTLRPGSKVIAMGHPRGLDFSITEGIVSAVRTTAELPKDAQDFLDAPSDQQWVQTTAAISGGNSGGPLMLPDGRVIGINTWVAPGENLGFAGHVRHVGELLKQAETEPEFDSLAHYNTAHGGLKRAIVSQADAFSEGFETVVRAAEQIDWQPTGAENLDKIQTVVVGLAFARTRGLSSDEINAFEGRLAARGWRYEDHVERLNAYSIDGLKRGDRETMFFGRVSEVGSKYVVKLIGRGYEVEVFDLYTPKQPRKVGDMVLILGVQAELNDATKRHVIASGLTTPTTWTPPRIDTARRECAEFLDRPDGKPMIARILIENQASFPLLQVDAHAAQHVRNTIVLNQQGQEFDMVRIDASKNNPDDDLLLFIAAPPDDIESWGITSLDGRIFSMSIPTYEFAGLAATGATWKPTDLCRLLLIPGLTLKDSRKHALWFKLKNDKPVNASVIAVYLDGDTLARGPNGMLVRIGVGPTTPNATLRMDLADLTASTVAVAAANSRSSAPASEPTTVPLRSRSEFGDRTLAHMPLPALTPEDIARAADIVPFNAQAEPALKLINPDAPAYGPVAKYEVVASADKPETWTVQAVTKKNERKTIGAFFVEFNMLRFRWDPSADKSEASPLRNCVLEATSGGKKRSIVLRSITRRDAMVLDFTKDLTRIPLVDELPADTGLKIVIDSLEGANEAPPLSGEKYPFRTAGFIVLRSAQPDVPGIRLRVVLWKSGLKPELLMRPELTPMATPEQLALIEQAEKGSGSSSTSTAASNSEQIDPTTSENQRYLTFTAKGLANAKRIVERQMVTVLSLLKTNTDLINSKRAKIDSYNGFTGTVDEVAAVQVTIARLRREIVALTYQVDQLKTFLPTLEKQLAAFPVLEIAGNAMHLKTTLQLRVVYQAGEYEVPVLRVAALSASPGAMPSSASATPPVSTTVAAASAASGSNAATAQPTVTPRTMPAAPTPPTAAATAEVGSRVIEIELPSMSAVGKTEAVEIADIPTQGKKVRLEVLVSRVPPHLPIDRMETLSVSAAGNEWQLMAHKRNTTTSHAIVGISMRSDKVSFYWSLGTTIAESAFMRYCTLRLTPEGLPPTYIQFK